jgi:hypothetical protein
MTQEFSCLRLIMGWYSALNVHYSKRNFSKIPICLKRRFAWLFFNGSRGVLTGVSGGRGCPRNQSG